MLKDDRMMGMLTVVVILVAFGTLLQRVNVFDRFLGWGGDAVELRADESVARVEQPTLIDVLANDSGLEAADAGRLTIVERPDCGRAVVREGKVEYVPGKECAGAHSFRYGLAGAEQAAEVRVLVALGDPSRDPAAAAGSDATVPRASAPPTPADAPATPGALAASGETGAATPGAAAGAGVSGATPDTAAGDAAATRTALARTTPDAPAASEAGAHRATRGAAAGDTPANRAGAAGGQGTEAVPGAARSGDAAPARFAPRAQGGSGETLAAVAADGRSGEAAAAGDDVTGDATGDAAGDNAAGDAAGDVACWAPPTVTLDAEPAAVTRVTVDAPCRAGTVAELAYDGLRFAIRLDARGRGSVAAPGFQRSSQAELVLGDGERFGFELTFREVERIDRVAVVWDGPVDLSLHAFEFGAPPGSDGHVRPARPRSFDAVRRDGGGWLATHEAAGEVGQNVAVYTFWRRYGGPAGVVKLALDPGRGSRAGTACQGGASPPADFKVIRAVGGRPERAKLRRLAPLDCAVLARGDTIIGDAVDDLIVRRR